MPYLLRASLTLPESSSKRDEYPYSVPSIAGLGKGLEFHPRCTFLVGENGVGKSTLLEALAVKWGFNAEGGTRNFNFGTRESHSELYRDVRLARSHVRPMDGFFLRAESFFNVASEIEKLDAEAVSGIGNPIIWSYGGKSLHEQSHGESFLSLFMHRFGDHSFYILDEPEAALSPSRQLAFLVRLHDLIGESCQFVIATHSPIIMAYPDAWIYELSGEGIARVEYEETEHYRLTRRFMTDRHRMLDYLLAPDEENEESGRD